MRAERVAGTARTTTQAAAIEFDSYRRRSERAPDQTRQRSHRRGFLGRGRLAGVAAGRPGLGQSPGAPPSGLDGRSRFAARQRGVGVLLPRARCGASHRAPDPDVGGREAGHRAPGRRPRGAPSPIGRRGACSRRRGHFDGSHRRRRGRGHRDASNRIPQPPRRKHGPPRRYGRKAGVSSCCAPFSACAARRCEPPSSPSARPGSRTRATSIRGAPAPGRGR